MDRATELRNQIQAINDLFSDGKYLKTQSYTFDSGQGKQSATYRSLTELRALKDDLEWELENLEGKGIIALDFPRAY